jgi:lysophospholipase L1-like esterase
MLVGAAGVEVYAGIPRPGFSDVGADVAPLYPVEYVAAASNSRLVRGFKDGLFRPWNTISRAQMVTMVVRAAAMYLPQGLTEPPAGWTGVTWGYDDATHGSNVHLAEYMGLLTGIDLRGWNPSQPASRGEVAQILLNLQRLRSPLVASEHIPALSLASGVLRAGVDSSPVEHQSTGNIVFDGDSLTFGSTATDPYPDQVMRVLRPEIRWVNFGIGGQKLYTMLENAPTKVDPLYDAALGRNVCVIWGGTNDIRWWGHKPPAVYQHLRDYCLGRRVKGFTVVVLTLLPRTDGDYPELFETYRQDVNRRIRQGWVGFADALIDVGADPLIGSAGCEVDLRFFSPDRVHLNNNGLALVAGRVLKLLERVDTPGDERVDAQVAQ